MMAISASMVKELRQKTGCGIMECKEALKEAEGNLSLAIEILRKKGLKMAAQKAGRATLEGQVGAYIHPGGKVGVLVELNCETDFVARTPEFQQLVKDLCLHIAAAAPLYISREDVPPEVIEKEKQIFRAQLADSGKPEHIITKIIQGKLEKTFFAEKCLLEQPFVKDQNITVQELINSKVAKLGENIVLRRFSRYQLGEE